MDFKNLDIQDIKVFGYNHPKSDCWLNMLRKAKGFNSIDRAKFEDSLALNVNDSYTHLASFVVKDLDTDTDYQVAFSNELKLWTIEIVDSKGAEIPLEDKVAIMKSELVERLVARVLEILPIAAEVCTHQIKQHIEAGELLKVDEIKLEAIEDMLATPQLLANLKKRLYVK